ncbi:T9SS type B sorting domain-containing protein [Flavobacterium sp.]|uniref:T9SS type B sorting domain-containing protein n=1 Tax=Flavobacterium sp. TaxID=239 RepID=UPI00374CE5BA
MFRFNTFLISFIFLITGSVFAQGGASSCAELEANYQLYQTCATNVPFQNSTGGNFENFNSTCIPSAYVGPTWFFVEVQTSGNITLQIRQTDLGGSGTDVDFILWGPFSNLTNICSQLNTSVEVDCSYSAASIENVTIPNALTGQLYVLLIDNFSGTPGNIAVSQIGGTGSSSCDFLSSVKIVDTGLAPITQFDYCKPTTKDIVAKIDVTDFPGLPANLRFNYKWYKNGILINTITNSTINTNTLNVSDTGVYKVETTAYDSTDPTVIIANLTVSSAQIDLKFYSTPTLSIANTNTKCLNSNPVLQSTITNQSFLDTTVDILTYQWFLNGNLITAATGTNYIPTLPGDYFVRVFNNPCINVDSNIIHIIANPAITIASNQVICEGSSYTITSNLTNGGLLSNLIYQWHKDGVAVSGATGNSYTVSSSNQALNSTSNYTLLVTEQGFCTTTTNTASITINALPIVNTTTILYEQCDFIAPTIDGIAITNLLLKYNEVTSSAGLTLYFYQDASMTIPILNYLAYQNTSSPFNQNIYVKAINENVTPNCPSIATAIIHLKINPTSISAYPNINPVCPVLNQNYGNIDFNAQRILIKNNYFPVSPVNISFYLSALEASTGTNQLTNSSNIPVGIQTIYTRIDTNGNCDGIGEFQIEILAAPIQNTITEVLVCESDIFILNTKDVEALLGQSLSVQASYFNNFTDAQNNINIINKNTQLPISAGNRTLFIRLYNTVTQCFSIVNFSLRVFPNPTIFTPLPIKLCGTTTATFNLNIRIPVISGGNTNYQVTFYETNADLLANNSIITPANYTSATRTLIVKVVDPTNNSCYKTSTLDLIVLSIPGATNNPTPIELCKNSGFTIFDLTSREIEMAGLTPLADIQFKYYINLTDAIANNTNFIINNTSFTNSVINYQKIYVRLNSKTNFNSETNQACNNILELELFVRPYPANNLSSNPYTICIDKNNTVVNPAIIETGLTTTDYHFIWYNEHNAITGNEIIGAVSDTYNAITEGNFSVKIINTTNVALCSTIINFSTKKSYIPFSIVGAPSELIAFDVDNTITAIASPTSPDYLYSIDYSGWQTSAVFTNIPEGEHTLTVKNKYECGEVSTQIIVVDYPKFFTPNGDGYNDTWNIGGTKVLDSIQIYIFDRYGKLIQEITPQNSWDGNFNGKALPSSDYWFKLIYKKSNIKKEFKSHFALKR